MLDLGHSWPLVNHLLALILVGEALGRLDVLLQRVSYDQQPAYKDLVRLELVLNVSDQPVSDHQVLNCLHNLVLLYQFAHDSLHD